MEINIQPILQNETVMLVPLQEQDFEAVYLAASDPKIWEQHPNKDRWKKEVFRNYFDGALQSKGAFRIIDKTTNQTIGCSRYYDHKEAESSIMIGYTFYATAYWGKGINSAVKALMLDHIYQLVSTVYFHVGAVNVRSQIAISRIGATKIAEQEVTYFGEQPRLNFVYRLTREDWNNKKMNRQEQTRL